MVLVFKIKLFLILCLMCHSTIGSISAINRSIQETIHVNAKQFEQIFYDNYKIFADNGSTTSDLRDMMDFLTQTDNSEKVIVDDIPNAEEPKECLKCRALANTIVKMKRAGKEREFLQKQAEYLCTNVNGIAKNVCSGLINLNTPIVEFILENNTNLESHEICDIVGQPIGCAVNHEFYDFLVQIDDEEPRRRSSQRHQDQTHHHSLSSDRNLTIVHITDVHYDPYYNPGGNAVCGQGACCRLNQGPPSNTENAAGKWGDYRDCDSPWDAVVDIIKNIKTQYQQIDYVYFTGDIVDHFTWETTKNGNLEVMQKFHRLLREEFDGIPVFPIIGNHEAHPGNVYSPPNFANEELSVQWLYDYLADDWLYWLPNSTIPTIKSEGYYTVLVKPGFRIIALNSNVCYIHNWWLLHDKKMFIKQLQWLHDTLKNAALDDEFVHILAHVPVNDKYCFSGWTREYRRIIEKFSYLITGQFNGHSHNDEFVVFYAKDDISKPINVAWNGASGTPFTYLNPNYRVYQAHPVTMEVLNFDTWIYNLTEANLNSDKPPRWFKEYSFKSRFEIEDLSLKSLDQLLKKFASNSEQLLTKYWQHKVKLADPQLIQGCDDKCLLDHLCDIVRNDYYDKRKCNELSDKFWESSEFLYV